MRPLPVLRLLVHVDINRAAEAPRHLLVADSRPTARAAPMVLALALTLDIAPVALAAPCRREPPRRPGMAGPREQSKFSVSVLPTSQSRRECVTPPSGFGRLNFNVFDKFGR